MMNGDDYSNERRVYLSIIIILQFSLFPNDIFLDNTTTARSSHDSL
jgi:hypothetical protein